jgi:peptidase S41-like protein
VRALLLVILQLAACPLAAADTPDVPITPGERAALIDGSIEKLKRFYVFPDTATKLERVIRSHTASQEFRSISSGSELARRLTSYLQDASRDKHFRVEFFATGVPPTPASLTPTAEGLEAQRLSAMPENFGFEQARHLPGNVGYLEIRGFYTAAIAAPTATAAMSFLANTDALIIDVRRNFGGEPESVAYVASYLFDESMHLDDLTLRWPASQTRQFWTAPTVPGLRFGAHKPVYILTSHATFSGGEAFVYNLQALRRAQIVGEVTAGAAHLTIRIRVSEHFTIAVPFGRSVNPTTGKDWEGTGVVPDVSTPADEAPNAAYRLALEEIIASSTDEARKAELRKLAEQGIVAD